MTVWKESVFCHVCLFFTAFVRVTARLSCVRIGFVCLQTYESASCRHMKWEHSQVYTCRHVCSAVQFFVLVYGLAGELNAKFLENLDIHIGEHDGSMHLAAF